MSGAARALVPWRWLAAAALAAVVLMAAARHIGFAPGALASRDGLAALREVAASLWPPDVSPRMLQRTAGAALQTLAISVVGSLIAVVIAAAIMPFACQALLARGPLVDRRRPRGVALALHHGARLCANLLRTVPYLVWALLLVYMVGLGPFPGALAIGLHTGGVLGRLYAQALDDLDPQPLAALRDAGAGRFQILLFGMLPAARPTLVAYTLYRWEVNLREAAILGFVGAGGLGFEVQRAIGEFNRHALMTQLIAIIVLVLAGEWLSARLRRALT